VPASIDADDRLPYLLTTSRTRTITQDAQLLTGGDCGALLGGDMQTVNVPGVNFEDPKSTSQTGHARPSRWSII
jgi:hypothetical protein